MAKGDPETGATRVLGYVVVDDVGTVINPLTLAGAPSTPQTRAEHTSPGVGALLSGAPISAGCSGNYSD